MKINLTMIKTYKFLLPAVAALVLAVVLFIFWLGSESDTEARIEEILAEFDASNPRSFYLVSGITDLGKAAVPVLEEMAESGSLYERWAAYVSLPTLLREKAVLEKEVLPVLRKDLEDNDPSLRLLASAQLVSFGEKETIPVLISLLDSEKVTLFSDPPQLVGEQANLYLKHFTGQAVLSSFKSLRKVVEEQVEYLDGKPGLNKNEKQVRDKLEKALGVSEETICKEIKDIERAGII